MKNTRSRAGLTKLILFDVDQTLLRVFPFHEKALRKTFKQYLNINATFFDIDFEGKLFSAIFNEIAKKHGINIKSRRLKEMLALQKKNFLEILPKRLDKYILPGVKNLLNKLSKKNVLGIVTGNGRKIGETILKRTSIYSYFKIFGYGDNVRSRDELVRRTINKAKNFSEVIIIGDSTNDITSAHANNAKAIAVNTGHQSKEILLKCMPELLIKSLKDKKVLEFLK